MNQQLLTSNRLPEPHRDGCAVRPSVGLAVSVAEPALAGALESLAEATAALAAAPDCDGVARILARRLARIAAAGRTTVWLTDTSQPTELRLAAAWPAPPDASLPTRVSLGEMRLAREILDRGRAQLARDGGSAVEILLRGAPTAPLWVVPLVAGGDYLGIVYLVAERPPLHQDHIARVLSVLGTQAAIALRAMGVQTAVRTEYAQFLAVAAHDLKNTATSIKGYTQLIRRQLPGDQNGRAERYTTVVEEQVGILCQSLTALVDCGRVQSGRLRLALEPVDLGALLESVTAGSSADGQADRIRLELPDVPVVGAWDAARLRRALSAVLDSTLQTSGEEQVLRVVLTFDDLQAEVRIGPLETEEPWPTPGDWSDSADLGLYLARGLVEAHGGTLAYRRTPGDGPALRLTLPRHLASG